MLPLPPRVCKEPKVKQHQPSTSECFDIKNLMATWLGAKETQIPVVDLLTSALQSFACGAFLALLLRLLAVLRRRSQRMTRQWQLREMQLLAQLEKVGREVFESNSFSHNHGSVENCELFER